MLHSRFSIFNSGKQISTFSKFRFAIPRGKDPILYGGGKKEERRWNTRAHQLIWYTIMLLYLIISQTRPRAEFRINEEKETAPRFVLSWISHFIKSENGERERERFTYIRILVSDRSEKKRDSPQRYSISNAQQKFMLSLYHPCVIRKRKLVGNICIV